MKYRKTLYLMGKIKEEMNSFIIKELKERGIRGIVPSHGAILVVLYMSKEPVSMKGIADRINRTQATVTVLIDKLVKFGYVKKIKRNTDRRTTYIEITKKGLEFEKTLHEISEAMNAKLHKNLSKTEADMLENILDKILDE